MPEFVGRLRTPRLVNAPSSPVVGEMYYDTDDNTLYYWNGTAWIGGSSSGAAEVHINPSQPSPRVGQLLWVDTDEAMSPGPRVAIDTWRTVGTSGEPAFENSWVSHSAPYVPQFRKRPDGSVEIRGLVKSGAANTTIFTLPVGYRPVGITTLHLATIGHDNTRPQDSELRIGSDGFVSVNPVYAGYVSLAARFSTDQSEFPSGVPVAPIVSALPGTPFDGQEVYYRVAQSPDWENVVWHLRYCATHTSSYKWEYLGGAEIDNRSNGTVTTASGSFVTLGGPYLAVPLAGTYDAEYGCQFNGGNLPVMSVKFGTAGAGSDDEAILTRYSNSSEIAASRRSRGTVAVAGQVIELVYREGSGSGTASFFRRWMGIKPVRVG